MAVLKWMLKLALFPLLLLLILAQWVGIFLTTFSTILTNLLAGLSREEMQARGNLSDGNIQG